ncbi:MAG: hypothetical protein JW888_03155, partial [Pirellulales bacterium]|nr:hypothetical protein [Pirellulales bacterium]
GAAGRAARSMPRPRKHYRRFRPYEKPVRALIVKPYRECLIDLLGSMLLAALVAAVLTLVVAIAASFGGPVPVSAQSVAYVLLVGIAGSWAVLVPAKCWEGVQGDTLIRRFVMMIIGLALGAFGWVCTQWLAIEIPNSGNEVLEKDFGLQLWMHMRELSPLSAHVVVFGVLMLLIRWWRQADPLRDRRLSLWSVAVTVIVAGIVVGIADSLGWAIIVIAAIMSISVQIASPWVNPRLRRLGPEE